MKALLLNKLMKATWVLLGLAALGGAAEQLYRTNPEATPVVRQPVRQPEPKTAADGAENRGGGMSRPIRSLLGHRVLRELSDHLTKVGALEFSGNGETPASL